jgi:hypothetical protein
MERGRPGVRTTLGDTWIKVALTGVVVMACGPALGAWPSCP